MKIITEGNLPKIPESLDESLYSPFDIGISVDIGTTTIVVTSWSLSNRNILSIVAEKNLQYKYGTDVINRINAAIKLENGQKQLHDTIINQLEKMFSAALSISSQKLMRGFRPSVSKIVITGNTTMLSFVANLSVEKMSSMPFEPASKFDFEIEWGKLSNSKISVIPSDTKVYFPPIVSAFIGADTVCALLCVDFSFDDENPILMADIGTNSEIALFLPKTENSDSKILCTAAAAGPAFEAANISFGMPAISGAIDKIKIENDEIVVNTIENTLAKGICGSGLISSISAFLENDFIDKDGRIKDEFEGKIDLTNTISINQNDIRNFQLAKSAVKTGIEYLIDKINFINNKKLYLSNELLEKTDFILAGGFGSKIDLEESSKIGLIPRNLIFRTKQIGNAALFGAAALLFSEKLKKKAKKIAEKAIQINLAAIPDFQNRFLTNLSF